MNDQQRQDSAELRRLLNDSKASTDDILDGYVRVIGEQLAALARRGNDRDGRGAVEVDLRGIDLRNATGQVPIAYFPVAEAAEDWPSEMDELLTTYDPSRETIVVVYKDSSAPLLYILD